MGARSSALPTPASIRLKPYSACFQLDNTLSGASFRYSVLKDLLCSKGLKGFFGNRAFGADGAFERLAQTRL